MKDNKSKEDWSILNGESMEAKVLKQNILYLIQEAFNRGYQQRLLEEYQQRHSVLHEAEEVRMNYQWEREGL